ncbi:ABC transporter ATP-binding protein (plasmid) [Rhizobium sp. ACO-34A]|nr:betaine/proline/choline family ABC transporter ATP-binding protein [Rhizobium sp. ACO-34A]ATN37278.1 ABC transporter ATP-binding protein [Rhizobium sp. ACO-34A]
MRNPVEAAPSDAIISCRNLWKVYGNGASGLTGDLDLTPEEIAARGWVAAVRNASLQIRRGEVFVIMGLSGSGKSTMVRLLTRLIDATAGQIMVDGQDMLQLNDQKLLELRKRKMGMVFQHFALLPNRTVLGNIAFPLQIRGASPQECEARARELVEVVGLKGRENNYPSQLSGGQQQRVGIARSLAGDPELWFLDEPFSALDPLIRNDLQDELLRLQSKLGKTVVFITHDLDEAIKLADRIAIMDHGEIVQIATPEELVLNPANDFIRRFTSKVPLAKVVKVGTIAIRKPDLPSILPTVDEASTVEEVASAFRDHQGPIGVTSSGKLVGTVDRDQLYRVLSGTI